MQRHVRMPFDALLGKDSAESTLTGKVKQKVDLKSFFREAVKWNRRPNPIAPNQADIVNWVLYDRISFTAGSTVPNNFKFFVVPIGTNSKTKVDTNLEQVSLLPNPLWMNVIGIGYMFSTNAIKNDIDAFLTSEYMEFWVSQKVYLEGRFECFPSGTGLYGQSDQTSQATWNVGLPALSNFFDVRLPAGLNLGGQQVTDGLIGVTILQGQSFHIECNAPAGGATLIAADATPTPGTGLTVNAYLYGILSRGVQ